MQKWRGQDKFLSALPRPPAGPLAVEKLVPAKFRKNKIAMPRIFGCLRRNWISSTATDTTSTLAFSTLQASSFWRAL
jgi:hypothetical protein